MDDPGVYHRSHRVVSSSLHFNTINFVSLHNCLMLLVTLLPGVEANMEQLLNEFYFGSHTYLEGLIVAMCYTVTQDQRGQKTNFFFFTVPAQALPYCMLLMSLLTGGPFALELSGILAAHLHDFLFRLWPEFGGGPNLLATPAFMSRIVQTPRILQRDYGTAVRPAPAARATAGRSTGAPTGSVLPDSWKTRGAGHRLG
jgi:Derlin-2/3